MGEWPEQIKDLPITFKEIFPIVLALEIWGQELRDQCIILHIDNIAAVYILNKQSSKDKDIMVLVRRFVLACMKFNILTKCVHLEGSSNILPDLVSPVSDRGVSAARTSDGQRAHNSPGRTLDNGDVAVFSVSTPGCIDFSLH